MLSLSFDYNLETEKRIMAHNIIWTLRDSNRGHRVQEKYGDHQVAYGYIFREPFYNQSLETDTCEKGSKN